MTWTLHLRYLIDRRPKTAQRLDYCRVRFEALRNALHRPGVNIAGFNGHQPVHQVAHGCVVTTPPSSPSSTRSFHPFATRRCSLLFALTWTLVVGLWPLSQPETLNLKL